MYLHSILADIGFADETGDRMDPSLTPAREVALPASIFATLRNELAREAGALPSIHALHAAGYGAGTECGVAFRAAVGGNPVELSEARFWADLARFLSRRGWGTLSHEASHNAVGMLRSKDWAESEASHGESVGCSFTAGLLSGLLSEIAGGPVAVLETACRSRGDAECAFAFGSEGVIHELYGGLLEGSDLADVMGSL